MNLYMFLCGMFLHGRKNLFFDWSTSMSGNMPGPNWHFGVLSPFNLLFYLIPRKLVVVSMPYYILVKLINISVSMKYVMDRWFTNLSSAFRVFFTLLYVFSFYNMEYYRAPMWLDLAFMFPLVMHGFFCLMFEGKYKCYLWSLCIAVVMSFQHTYMLGLCLLYMTGGLILLYEKTRTNLLKLLLVTVEAALLTGLVWLPGVIQIMTSKRASHNHTIGEIWSSVWLFFPGKWVKLIGLGIPFSFFVIYLVKQKIMGANKDKNAIFLLFIMGILTAPFVFESIHLFWHGGSYQGYPIRFGYMVSFWIMIAGAYAIDQKKTIESDNRLICLATNIIGIVGIGCIFGLFFQAGRNITFIKILICLFIEIILGICFYVSTGKLAKVLMALFIVSHTFLAVSYSLIQASGKMDNFIIRSQDVYEQRKDLFESQTPLDRIKALTTVSNNYGLVMGQSTLASYLSVAGREQQDFLRNLGYAVVGDRLTDKGGTVFSDMLLGIDYAFSEKDENEALYTLVSRIDNWNIYKCKYRLSTGLLLGQVDEMVWKEKSPFANQNRIAKQWFDQELFHIYEKEGNTITLNTEPNSVLYLYTDQMETIRCIEVQNSDSGISKRKELSQSYWDSGIQELGSWNGENVTISVLSENNIDHLQAAVISLDDLAAIQPQYGNISDMTVKHTGMSFKIVADGNQFLSLPIYQDKGWHCKVNGKQTKLCLAVNMLAIPLAQGVNIVDLYYTPPGLLVGICLSLVGLCAIICVRVMRANGFSYPQKQVKLLNAGVLAVWATVLLIMYVASILGNIIYIIKLALHI